MSELSILGRRLPKVNAWAHLTGTARYADDIDLPRMLYGRLLRSTRPHARIVKIDARRALALPGVVGVVTGADMPEKMGIMPSTQDETALAVDKVRYVGEPVAAVAALDEDTAYDALSLIDVVYEDTAPPFDPFARRRSETGGDDERVGGHGIALVTGLVDSAIYSRIDGRNRIALVLGAAPRATA